VAAATCSHWFLARGFFYPEDGGDTFLRNGFTQDLRCVTSQNTAFFIICTIQKLFNMSGFVLFYGVESTFNFDIGFVRSGAV
jgi:hypothetical protein